MGVGLGRSVSKLASVRRLVSFGLLTANGKRSFGDTPRPSFQPTEIDNIGLEPYTMDESEEARFERGIVEEHGKRNDFTSLVVRPPRQCGPRHWNPSRGQTQSGRSNCSPPSRNIPGPQKLCHPGRNYCRSTCPERSSQRGRLDHWIALLEFPRLPARRTPRGICERGLEPSLPARTGAGVRSQCGPSTDVCHAQGLAIRSPRLQYSHLDSVRYPLPRFRSLPATVDTKPPGRILCLYFRSAGFVGYLRTMVRSGGRRSSPCSNITHRIYRSNHNIVLVESSGDILSLLLSRSTGSAPAAGMFDCGFRNRDFSLDMPGLGQGKGTAEYRLFVGGGKNVEIRRRKSTTTY